MNGSALTPNDCALPRAGPTKGTGDEENPSHNHRQTEHEPKHKRAALLAGSSAISASRFAQLFERGKATSRRFSSTLRRFCQAVSALVVCVLHSPSPVPQQASPFEHIKVESETQEASVTENHVTRCRVY